MTKDKRGDGELWRDLVKDLTGERPTIPDARPPQHDAPAADAAAGFPPEVSPVRDELDDLEEIPPTVELQLPEDVAGVGDDDYGDAPTIQLSGEQRQEAEAAEEFEDAPTIDQATHVNTLPANVDFGQQTVDWRPGAAPVVAYTDGELESLLAERIEPGADADFDLEGEATVSLVARVPITTQEQPAAPAGANAEPVRPSLAAPTWAGAVPKAVAPARARPRGASPSPRALDAEHDSVLPGRRFGRYRLLRRLKAGGMGEVLQAATTWGAGVERMVAIKRVLLPLIERDDFVRRFYDEARIMVQLDHPAIVSLLEFGMVGDEYFIAMEYVAGRDLETLIETLRERALECPVEVAVHIVRQLLAGLDHAHRAHYPDGRPLGLVHRDVSPPNILCGFDGEVKLTDFGVAQAVGKRSLTAPGQLLGKLAYMSPEQIGHKEIDCRSDLFAAGAILHELLRGEPLFTDKTEIEIMKNVREAPIPSLRQSRPEISVELDTIAKTALLRDPAYRFSSADEMARALGRADQGGGRGRAALAALMKALFHGAPAGKPLTR